MENYQLALQQAAEWIRKADAVVLGVGAGLSDATGITYTPELQDLYFPDFVAKYGYSDPLRGIEMPFETNEEKWAYWIRLTAIYCYYHPQEEAYLQLQEIMAGTDHFVITSNVDHALHNHGFDSDRLFEFQGTLTCYQCSVPCRRSAWSNRDEVDSLYHQYAKNGMTIPTEAIPQCPYCGAEAFYLYMGHDNEMGGLDPSYQIKMDAYQAFLAANCKTNILYLEIGTGYMTPGIYKYPFQINTIKNPNARYLRINQNDHRLPPEIKNQALIIDADVAKVIADLYQLMS